MRRIAYLFIHLCVLSTIEIQFSAARSQDDPGEPLFLTPYLNEGKIDEARRLRLVFH